MFNIYHNSAACFPNVARNFCEAREGFDETPLDGTSYFIHSL